jgi:hypothetical protein
MESVAVAPAEAAPPPTETPAGQPAAPAAATTKAKRGGIYPSHVRPMQTAMGTKYFARLAWLPAGATSKKDGGRYDVIPGGPWLKAEEAAAAQAAAQVRLDAGGPEAVWPNGLPGANGLRQKRDAAYWAADTAAREAKAEEKAAQKAAREAAEALRPKKVRRSKEGQRTTVPLPANRDTITVECTRDFLVDPTPAGGENAVPAWAQLPPMPSPAQPSPLPVAPGLDIMQANV